LFGFFESKIKYILSQGSDETITLLIKTFDKTYSLSITLTIDEKDGLIVAKITAPQDFMESEYSYLIYAITSHLFQVNKKPLLRFATAGIAFFHGIMGSFMMKYQLKKTTISRLFMMVTMAFGCYVGSEFYSGIFPKLEDCDSDENIITPNVPEAFI